MKRSTKWFATAAVAFATLGGATGVALADGSADREAAITGDALGRASAGALEHTGEGRVSETEVGDEESYYEVEVTLDDGSQVDVQLDRSFNVVGATADQEDDKGGDSE